MDLHLKNQVYLKFNQQKWWICTWTTVLKWESVAWPCFHSAIPVETWWAFLFLCVTRCVINNQMKRAQKRGYQDIKISRYQYLYVFPNRIENDRNGNSSNCIRRPGPFAMQLALRLCFCLMPIASISTSSQKIRNAVVVSHVKIHPTRQSVKLARGKSERLRWDKNHCIRKSAATTWLQRTLGGVIVGLTTLWIARYNMGVCLVIQKSPEKIEMGKSLPHW